MAGEVALDRSGDLPAVEALMTGVGDDLECARQVWLAQEGGDTERGGTQERGHGWHAPFVEEDRRGAGMREQMVAMLERLQGVVGVDGETVGRRSDRGFEHLASRQPAAALVRGEQTSDRARDSGGEHAFGVGVVGDDRDAEQSSGALAGDDLVHVGRRGQGRPRRELDREILAAGGVGDEHEA